MQIIRPIVFLCLLGASACEDPAASRLLAETRSGLDEELKDYPTARFRNVRMTNDASMICGEVNAKNALGAYSGWAGFMALPGRDEQPALVIVDVTGEEPGNCGEPPSQFRADDFSDSLSAAK